MSGPAQDVGRLGWKLAELVPLTGLPLRTLYGEVYAGRLAAVRVGTRGLWISAQAFADWQAARAYVPKRGAR